MRGTWTAAGLLAFTCATVFALPQPYSSNITPTAQAYEIPASLAGVRHLEKAKDLTPARREALAGRGFVVVPDRAEQMFFLYEDYGENEEKGPIPNFITVDSVLQTYHIFFDFALRSAEQDRLLAVATALTHACAGASAQQLRAAAELNPAGSPLQEAAARNLAYFLVARKLLTGQEPSNTTGVPDRDRIMEMAGQELERIAVHEGRFPSAIMGRTVQYDQFVPRGHYTRSEELGRYFQALMWYGTVPFELDAPAEPADLVRRHVLQALLITKALSQNQWAQETWERVFEPTEFFVGGADDLTWRQYLPPAQQVFGKDLALKELADAGKLDSFIALARARLPRPVIAPALLQADDAGSPQQVRATPQGRQFRFMGQRFIPDSYAMQQLVWPLVGTDEQPRYWPLGLDLMAVLGSQRARDLAADACDQKRFRGFGEQLAKVTGEFAARPEAQWWQNLYWAWLHCLQPLLEPKAQGYPTFMRSTPWLDKELMTAHGSWAQLRHDTVLYGKPSGAEMGAGPPVMVQGYVEPYPEVFGRLAYLAHLTRDGLQARGLLSEKIRKGAEKFGSILLFLKSCAEKELTGVALTAAEYDRIQFFGGEIERATLEVGEGGEGMTSWYQIANETDRYMATIADVHTNFARCLEVGVGNANRIYVIVPDPKGGLQIAKGGVMSYYEFQWPVGDRLTDEKWIGMLKAGSNPPMPAWTQSFVVP